MFRWYISWYIDLINMPRGYINWRLSLPPLGTITYSDFITLKTLDLRLDQSTLTLWGWQL